VMTAIFAASVVPDTTWERFLSLRQNLQTGTLGGRGMIWTAGWDLFQRNPIVGIGAGAFGPVVESRINARLIAHNTYLSVATETGVIGLALFVSAFGSIAASARRCDRSRRVFVLVLLATWMVGVSSLTWEHRKGTWIVFGVCTAAVLRRHRDRAAGGAMLQT